MESTGLIDAHGHHLPHKRGLADPNGVLGTLFSAPAQGLARFGVSHAHSEQSAELSGLASNDADDVTGAIGVSGIRQFVRSGRRAEIDDLDVRAANHLGVRLMSLPEGGKKGDWPQ
jgi:hypothetical protein